MATNSTYLTLLLSIILSGSYVTAQISLSFIGYPIDSQQCLYNSAGSSGCPTSAMTTQDINKCLCANDGNFIGMSAQCVANNDPTDLQQVWDTMVVDCAATYTPIQYNEEKFLAFGGSSTSSFPPPPQSSARVSRPPSPTTMSTSIRAPGGFSIPQGSSVPTSSQQLPSPSTTRSTSPSMSSTPGSSNNNNNNNSNNVGKLSGGIIGLIGSVAAVCALIIGLLTWCGCFRGKRSCSLFSFGQKI